MKKSGLIIGGIAVIFSFAITLLSPFLLPCITPILGLAAGYMAGVFDHPRLKNAATKGGAKAAALGGLGMLLGQVVGAVINGVMVGPEGALMILNSFGFAAGSPAQLGGVYWTALVLSTTCISVFNIALMAGLGALGALIWWEVAGKNVAVEIV